MLGRMHGRLTSVSVGTPVTTNGVAVVAEWGGSIGSVFGCERATDGWKESACPNTEAR